MRLLCPKCDAEYELADGIIPSSGRDVQCSSCETIWLVEFNHAPLKSSAIDPDIISILQQEAQRELAARNVETSTILEPSGMVNAAETAERSSREQFAHNAENPSILSNHLPPIQDAAEKSDKDAFTSATNPQLAPEDDVPPLNNRQRGILTALTLLGALTALYVFAPEITEAFPNYTDWVNFYIFWIDDIRQWLQNSWHKILDYRQSFG